MNRRWFIWTFLVVSLIGCNNVTTVRTFSKLYLGAQEVRTPKSHGSLNQQKCKTNDACFWWWEDDASVLVLCLECLVLTTNHRRKITWGVQSLPWEAKSCPSTHVTLFTTLVSWELFNPPFQYIWNLFGSLKVFRVFVTHAQYRKWPNDDSMNFHIWTWISMFV